MEITNVFDPVTNRFYVRILVGKGCARLFNSVTKPTARQVRVWKKKTSVWYRDIVETASASDETYALKA